MMERYWVYKTQLVTREAMEDLITRGIASREYFIQVVPLNQEDEWITQKAKEEDGAMVNAGKPPKLGTCGHYDCNEADCYGQ